NPGTRTRCARRESFTRSPSRRGAVALLVLLAAAAGAWIVAPHFFRIAPDGLDLLRSRGRIPARQSDARRRPLAAALPVGGGGGPRRLEVPPRGRFLRHHEARLGGGLRLELDAHQLLDHVRLHPADQLLEEVVALLLILLEGILLPVAAQPDAFLQVIHAEEMVAPERVERLQPDDA